MLAIIVVGTVFLWLSVLHGRYISRRYKESTGVNEHQWAFKRDLLYSIVAKNGIKRPQELTVRLNGINSV